MLHGAVKKGKTCEMILQSQTFFGGGSMRFALFCLRYFLWILSGEQGSRAQSDRSAALRIEISPLTIDRAPIIIKVEKP